MNYDGKCSGECECDEIFVRKEAEIKLTNDERRSVILDRFRASALR